MRAPPWQIPAAVPLRCPAQVARVLEACLTKHARLASIGCCRLSPHVNRPPMLRRARVDLLRIIIYAINGCEQRTFDVNRRRRPRGCTEGAQATRSILKASAHSRCTSASGYVEDWLDRESALLALPQSEADKRQARLGARDGAGVVAAGRCTNKTTHLCSRLHAKKAVQHFDQSALLCLVQRFHLNSHPPLSIGAHVCDLPPFAV